MQTSDIIQAQFRSIAVVQPSRLRPHGFESRCADRRREAHEQSVPFAILHDPRPETIAEEVELRGRILVLATSVLAIDDMRLVRVHLEAALREPLRERNPYGLRLRLALAVDQPVVRIPTPGNTRKRSRHPGVKRIVQEQIRQGGTDHAALRSSFGPLDQSSVRKLQRRRQPSPNIKPNPFAVRVFLQRPQQKLVGDVVEQSSDVEFQSSIVSPAALARNCDGVQRRFLRPIPIGVRQKDGFQKRFEDCFDDRLRHAIRHRRHTPSELRSLPIDLGDRRPLPIPFIPYVGERLRF